MNERRRKAVKGGSRSRFQRLFGTCERARFLISKSLDKKLSWGEALQTYGHLATCSSCRHYRNHLQIIRRLIRCYCAAHPEVAAAWRLSDEARERIKKVIRDKEQMPESQQNEIDLPGYSFHFQLARWWARQLAAVIAVRIKSLSCSPSISPV